jgi:hypothetical protein
MAEAKAEELMMAAKTVANCIVAVDRSKELGICKELLGLVLLG